MSCNNLGKSLQAFLSIQQPPIPNGDLKPIGIVPKWQILVGKTQRFYLQCPASSLIPDTRIEDVHVLY